MKDSEPERKAMNDFSLIGLSESTQVSKSDISLIKTDKGQLNRNGVMEK